MKEKSAWPAKVPGQIIVTVLVVPLALWLAWAFFGARSVLNQLEQLGVSNEKLALLGQVGDLFGGVNALFAALAFGFVAIGAYYQASSTVLLQRQHDQQSFEPLFFQLLQLFRSTAISKASLRPDGWASLDDYFWPSGEQPISFLAEAVRREVVSEMAHGAHLSINNVTSEIDRRFMAVLRTNENALAVYFRSLYHVFKTIDLSNLRDDAKINYANIARSLLTADDLLLLTLNCRRDKNSNFISLIEKYGLMKHARTIPRMNDGERDPDAVYSLEELTWFEEARLTDNLGIDRYLIKETFRPQAQMGSAERKHSTDARTL